MKVRMITVSALIIALLIITAPLKFKLGELSFTLQTFFVMFSALLLGKKGWIPVLLYVAIGLAGVPVFSDGGGIAYILKLSFGYIIGFVVSSLVVGFLLKKESSFLYDTTIVIIGTVIIYAIGIPYANVLLRSVVHKPMSYSAMLTPFMLVFLPGDILKAVIAVWVSRTLKQRGVRYDD